MAIMLWANHILTFQTIPLFGRKQILLMIHLSWPISSFGHEPAGMWTDKFPPVFSSDATYMFKNSRWQSTWYSLMRTPFSCSYWIAQDPVINLFPFSSVWDKELGITTRIWTQWCAYSLYSKYFYNSFKLATFSGFSCQSLQLTFSWTWL